MKVRVLQCIRGPAISLDPGDIYEGDAKELARWCAHGIAEAMPEKRATPEKPLNKKRKKAVLE